MQDGHPVEQRACNRYRNRRNGLGMVCANEHHMSFLACRETSNGYRNASRSASNYDCLSMAAASAMA
jgi:hypothetical protein